MGRTTNEEGRPKDEGSITFDFLWVFRKRQKELRAQFGSNLGLSDPEKKILKDLQRIELSFMGVASALAGFWICRGIRGVIGRRLFGGRNKQRYSPFHNKAPPNFHKTNDKKPSRLVRGFSLLFDASAGTVVGMYASIYFQDPSYRTKIKKSFAESPLVEGRSGIADQFCDVLVKEYNQQWKNATMDQKEILKNSHVENLQVLLDFIQNCKKRKVVEQQLCKDKGLQPNTPVAIPSPGVTALLGPNSQFEIEAGGDDWNDYGGEETSGDYGDWNQEDVASFVLDREVSSGRR